jgi:hypothetical protein
MEEDQRDEKRGEGIERGGGKKEREEEGRRRERKREGDNAQLALITIVISLPHIVWERRHSRKYNMIRENTGGARELCVTVTVAAEVDVAMAVTDRKKRCKFARISYYYGRFEKCKLLEATKQNETKPNQT